MLRRFKRDPSALYCIVSHKG